VCPTYAWRVPRIFAQWLQLSRLEGSRKAYFVMTCGSSIGAADGVNGPFVEKLGLQYMGTLELVMPENYVAMFSVPKEADCRRMIRSAESTLDGILMNLVDEQPLEPVKNTPLRKLLTASMHRGFYKFFVKADPFYVTEGCTGCGRCESHCPLNNIKMENGKPTWGDACTHCMACIGGCPVGAIEYGKKTPGKLRYFLSDHPENK